MEEIVLRPVKVNARLEGSMVEVKGGLGWGPIHVEEPPEVGGSGKAPSPLDLAAASLASCEAFMFSMIAGKLGIKFSGVEVEAELDFGLGEGLRRARLIFRVKGGSREDAERVVELVRKLCPIYTTIARSGAQVEDEIIVE